MKFSKLVAKCHDIGYPSLKVKNAMTWVTLSEYRPWFMESSDTQKYPQAPRSDKAEADAVG